MDQRHDARAAWLVGAGLLVLTLSCGAAVCRAPRDTASVVFVVASYLTLLLLFLCLRAYELAPLGEAGGRRGRMRRAVWSLSTLLTVMFAWRVAAVMPYYWPAALLVWTLSAAAATVGGFVVILFHRHP
ncbi:unnamed protein product [Urochloa humidicola]